MSLISKREQIYLLDWAKTAESHMAESSVSDDSYFIERRNDDSYLVEYVFDTMQNMDQMIQKVLGKSWDESLRKVCEVAALKERSRKIEERENTQTMVEEQHKEESQIPEFIYNF